MAAAINLFSRLGFNIHPEKCIFIPRQIIELLGFVINSLEMTVSLSQEKCAKIIGKCSAVLGDKKTEK